MRHCDLCPKTLVNEPAVAMEMGRVVVVKAATAAVTLPGAAMAERAALLGDDVQARRPATRVSLSRVGVTGVDKVLRIRSNGLEQLFYAELECFVDLPPDQVRRQRWQSIDLAARATVFDHHVLTLDVTEFGQTFADTNQTTQVSFWRAGGKKADYWHRPLLRSRR